MEGGSCPLKQADAASRRSRRATPGGSQAHLAWLRCPKGSSRKPRPAQSVIAKASGTTENSVVAAMPAAASSPSPSSCVVST